MPRYIVTVEVMYDGPITARQVHDLFDSALEHCRQESMLSDPSDYELSCSWLGVVEAEEVE